MDIRTFKGLNNVTDPLRLGMGWLVKADNVDITDTGGLAKRAGYSLARTGAFTGAYTTLDFTRMYLIDGGYITTFDGTQLAQLTSTAQVFWAETNGHVYYNNGVDSGVIAPDNEVGPWRDAAVSYGAGFKGDDGQDLDVLYTTLPPETDVIQFWKGAAYAAQYLHEEATTIVWVSEPLGFHLFNRDNSFFMVPGRVLMLAPTPDALIIGTDSAVWAMSTKLEVLATYGVVPGQHWVVSPTSAGRVIFWSTRGACTALPFENLTEAQASVLPGMHAGGAIIQADGQQRYLVTTRQGGSAFNPHTKKEIT